MEIGIERKRNHSRKVISSGARALKVADIKTSDGLIKKPGSMIKTACQLKFYSGFFSFILRITCLRTIMAAVEKNRRAAYFPNTLCFEIEYLRCFSLLFVKKSIFFYQPDCFIANNENNNIPSGLCNYSYEVYG